MGQSFSLIKSAETGKIIGAEAECNGDYNIPEKGERIKGDFSISSEDVIALLTLFNGGLGVSNQIGYANSLDYGLYFSKENEAIARLSDELKEYQDGYDKLSELSSERADRLLEAKKRLNKFTKAYDCIPGWAKKMLFLNSKELDDLAKTNFDV